MEVDGSIYIRCLYRVEILHQFNQYLRTWGKTGTPTTKVYSTPKPRDRRLHYIIIQYADKYVVDHYQM